MPDIGNIGSNIGTAYGTGISGVRSATDATARRVSDTTSATTRTAGDRVEVSEVARWLEEMNRLPEIRQDKVAAAKAAIAAGTLDSDEKLAIALDRMIDEVL